MLNYVWKRYRMPIYMTENVRFPSPPPFYRLCSHLSGSWRHMANSQGIAPKGEWDMPVEEAIRGSLLYDFASGTLMKNGPAKLTTLKTMKPEAPTIGATSTPSAAQSQKTASISAPISPGHSWTTLSGTRAWCRGLGLCMWITGPRSGRQRIRRPS